MVENVQAYYLKLGYRSLFEYCVKRFNLSEGSVYRRTQVAGVCHNVRFSAGSAFTEKLTRLAEVLGVERPQDHLEEILSRALEIALEKTDPQRKLERRREREARKESPRPGEAEEDQRSCPCEEETRKEAETSSTEPAAPHRHVPAAVRERVLERAGYRCEYRGPDGTRCSSRTGLQVEHTLPFAVYRTHEEKYLRAFCPAHNLLAAREFYGREFIQEKIHAARGENVERCAASALP